MSNTHLWDPDARLDCVWDWSKWLPDGDTIASHTVTPTVGVTVHSGSATATRVTAWLSATTSGSVTCHIVTVQGREDDRTQYLQVIDR